MNIIFLLHPKDTVQYLYDDNTIRQALEKLRRHSYTAVCVIKRSGEYVGTVTEGDFLWNLLDGGFANLRELEEYPVSSILRKDWNPPVTISTGMDELLQRVMEQNFVPVVDDRGCFVGIITRRDVIKNLTKQKNKMDAGI